MYNESEGTEAGSQISQLPPRSLGQDATSASLTTTFIPMTSLIMTKMTIAMSLQCLRSHNQGLHFPWTSHIPVKPVMGGSIYHIQ